MGVGGRSVDCDILDVSTPEVGTTLRLEDDYSRGDEILG